MFKKLFTFLIVLTTVSLVTFVLAGCGSGGNGGGNGGGGNGGGGDDDDMNTALIGTWRMIEEVNITLVDEEEVENYSLPYPNTEEKDGVYGSEELYYQFSEKSLKRIYKYSFEGLTEEEMLDYKLPDSAECLAVAENKCKTVGDILIENAPDGAVDWNYEIKNNKELHLRKTEEDVFDDGTIMTYINIKRLIKDSDSSIDNLDINDSMDFALFVLEFFQSPLY